MLHLLPLLLAFALDARQPAADREHVCMPTAQLHSVLKDQYGQVPLFAGVDGNGVVVSVYGMPDRTGHSVFVSRDGMSCSLGAGVAWQSFNVPVPSEKEEL